MREIKTCKKHKANPIVIYGNCPACEIESYRGERNGLREQLKNCQETKNRLDVMVCEAERERNKYKAALEEVISRGPHEHFEYYWLAKEALK